MRDVSKVEIKICGKTFYAYPGKKEAGQIPAFVNPEGTGHVVWMSQAEFDRRQGFKQVQVPAA